MFHTAPRIARLADMAIIAVGDVDARSFLHAQLSRSLTNLPPSVAPLAGWHDARGRVRAVFRVVPTDERWLLLTSAATVQTILAKLRMFVLRARVTLATAGDLHVDALIGDARAWLEAQRIELAEPPNALARAHDIDWVRIGPDLIYALGTDDALRAAGRDLDEAPIDLAELAELRCGIPRIDAALSEKYIAQMLNLDVLDAVSFDKGCYPGQEIIARTHHLGAVKRRLRRFAAAGGGVPAPGTGLIGPGQEAAGEVVRAARAGAGIELLAVVRLDRAPGDLFVAGSHDALRELPLPYSS